MPLLPAGTSGGRGIRSDCDAGVDGGASRKAGTMENSVVRDRRQRVRRKQPTREEVRAVFHRLWTKEVGKQDYVKRDWRELRDMIFRLTGIEL